MSSNEAYYCPFPCPHDVEHDSETAPGWKCDEEIGVIDLAFSCAQVLIILNIPSLTDFYDHLKAAHKDGDVCNAPWMVEYTTGVYCEEVIEFYKRAKESNTALNIYDFSDNLAILLPKRKRSPDPSSTPSNVANKRPNTQGPSITYEPSNTEASETDDKVDDEDDDDDYEQVSRSTDYIREKQEMLEKLLGELTFLSDHMSTKFKLRLQELCNTAENINKAEIRASNETKVNQIPSVKLAQAKEATNENKLEALIKMSTKSEKTKAFYTKALADHITITDCFLSNARKRL